MRLGPPKVAFLLGRPDVAFGEAEQIVHAFLALSDLSSEGIRHPILGLGLILVHHLTAIKDRLTKALDRQSWRGVGALHELEEHFELGAAGLPLDRFVEQI